MPVILSDEDWARTRKAIEYYERLAAGGPGQEKDSLEFSWLQQVTVQIFNTASGGYYPGYQTWKNLEDPTDTWYNGDEVRVYELNGGVLQIGVRYPGTLKGGIKDGSSNEGYMAVEVKTGVGANRVTCTGPLVTNVQCVSNRLVITFKYLRIDWDNQTEQLVDVCTPSPLTPLGPAFGTGSGGGTAGGSAVWLGAGVGLGGGISGGSADATASTGPGGGPLFI